MHNLKQLCISAIILFSIHTELFSQSGISFDGINDYVSFGTASGLNCSQFTLEIWFKREGTGVAVQTDLNGVIAYPLLSKGRMESEGNNLDMNYFLGIDSATNTICADFEEGSAQPNPGMNHPISGTTSICNYQWYHAAVSYDGATLKLFLNGRLENSLTVNALPQAGSIQHASLGTTLNSSGVAKGFFNGRLDDARIWNIARSGTQINSSYFTEINSAIGLIGHWSMNEGSGTVSQNTGTALVVNGTLLNGPLWVTGTPFAADTSQQNTSLTLEGVNSYISFGNNLNLGLSQFTLETWFMRKGPGSPAASGSGGVVAIPLIAKGRGESDGNNRDMNYFLGIDTATGFLIADFEEAIGERNPGRNHPILGATLIENNVWYHAAVSYDGATWNLYLNGNLENQLFIGQLPQSMSIQHASVGSALNSVGTPEGYFNGQLDEVRIWNFARSQNEIRQTMNAQITQPDSGLILRLGMNAVCGVAVVDGSGNGIISSLLNKNWYWSSGAGFNLPVPLDPPTSSIPVNQSGNVYLNSNLSVGVSDPEGKNLTVTYYFQPCPNPAPQDFTIVGLPDTQHYVSNLFGGTNEMLKSQMTWITQHKDSANIVYVHGLGDCVQNGDNGEDPIEWERFDTAMKKIEDPLTTMLTDGIPYGLNVGNHDQTPIGDVNGTTNFFNSYFGESRFLGRNYYGGHFGSNNNNNFSLFSVGGIDFIVINLEYNLNLINPAVATWVRNLLSSYPDHLAIIGSHNILNGDGTFAPQGLAIYNVIKRYPNVVLTQSGHVSAESRREDIYDSKRIISIMADYQSRSYGGSGWMRLLKFSPLNNTLTVHTYSPWLNQFETDSNSLFTYSFDLSPRSGYSILGTNSNVTSGSIDSFPINNLLANTCYFWYVTIDNGTTVTKSPVWQFSTVTECSSINSFSPGTGLEGDTVLITGKNFSVVSSVSFNGTSATYILINDSVLKAIVPVGALTGKIILKGSCTDSSSSNFILNNCSSYPIAFSITGGGVYCVSPGIGSEIGLSGSEADVMYQLKLNNVLIGNSIQGTSGQINFGNQTQAGQYTIVATRASTCSTMMSGQTMVSIASNPVINLSVIQPINCFGANALLSVQGTGGLSPYQNTGNILVPAGAHTFTISDANFCTSSNTITLNEPSKVEGIITTQNETCGSSNGSATVSVIGGTPGYSYLWSNGQTNQTASGLSAGSYSVGTTDQFGCTGITNTTITNSGVLPGQAGTIYGANEVCRNTALTFSIYPVLGATSYTWTLPAGASGSSVSNNITVYFSNTFMGGFICVTGDNSCAGGALSCKNISILPSRPLTPGAIVGPATTCPLNTYNFSIATVPNATGYFWSSTGSGVTILSGQGTNSVSISIGSGFTTGNILVYASNCIGNSNSVSKNIQGLPIHTSSIVGPLNICANSLSNTYSINTIPGADSYLWSIISGDLQIVSQNATMAIVNAGLGFNTGVISVAAINSCGSYSKTLSIRSTPNQPGGISGLNNGLCLVNNIIYSISSVVGANSYTWTFPTGVQIVSNSQTSVTLDYGSGFTTTGNVCVTANNVCGQSTARCLPVKATLSPPSTINGPSTVCKSERTVLYTIPTVAGALSYLWSASGGAYVTPLGNGSSATADYFWTNTNSLFISVNTENLCGYGTGIKKTISVNTACREEAMTDLEANDFTISPNPSLSISTLSIYLKNTVPYTVTIKNIIGQVIISESGSFIKGLNEKKIDLGLLPKGVYIVSLELEKFPLKVAKIVHD